MEWIKLPALAIKVHLEKKFIETDRDVGVNLMKECVLGCDKKSGGKWKVDGSFSRRKG